MKFADDPDRFADYSETDKIGRRVEVHVAGKFANKFWDDFADQHVKIFDLHPADRRRS